MHACAQNGSPLHRIREVCTGVDVNVAGGAVRVTFCENGRLQVQRPKIFPFESIASVAGGKMKSNEVQGEGG